MFKNLNLKTKIISSIIMSSFLLCIIFVSIIYFYFKNSLVDEKLNNISKINTEQAHESKQIFEKNQMFAKMIATRPIFKDYLLKPTEINRKEILDSLSTYTKEDSKYLSLYLIDKNGKALISTDPSFVGQDYSFRDYYKEGIKGNSYVDILLGKTSNQFGYYFSYPVFDNNKNVLGIFVSKVDNKEIDSSILDSEISKENGVMLTDKYGIVIASNKPERFLKSLGKLNSNNLKIILESKKYLDKEILSLQYDKIQDLIIKGYSVKNIEVEDKEDGEIEIFDINKIDGVPFYIVTETGLETISNSIIIVIIILLLLMIFGVIIWSFVLYNLFTRAISPLKDLKIFAENISSGNLSNRIDIKTKDEFGSLAESFNKMANELEISHNNLEEKIKERTRELENSKDSYKKTLVDVERMNKLMIGRELEMINLKKEILDLKNNN